MSILRLDNVTKQFGEHLAVDNVSFLIEEGEIFGLLGPNGAGKSTVINMIVGLLAITKGKIFFLDKDITKNKLFTRSHMGIVPQDIAIYEDLQAIENVKFFAGLYGLRGKNLAAAAENALAFTGLADKAKSYPKAFSGGMKRRLNIACAIAHRPKLIIMDEPTVGIDPQSRNHILQAVKQLNRMGCTIIYTSHYMEEVEEICSRIAIMDHGKIIAQGTKDELKALITDANVVWITIGGSVGKLNEKEIKAIPGVTHLEISENVVKISNAKEVNNLDKIISYFMAQGVMIKSVESKIPDLETVFLALTGRKLRD